mgnify:CR=1 FL=1
MATNFIDKLKNFNRNEIPEKVTKSLDKFQKETPEFDLDIVKN